ncbi:MAG: hypothetical protein WC686_00745 [Candidatus Shapirobacteria bacterium]|jgi:zinc transporter ZupT
MDPTQLVIILSIVIITAVIVYCGIWLAMILQELRQTINKTNAILDDTKLITSSVTQPFTSMAEFFAGFKNGVQLFNSFFAKRRKANQ